MRSPLIVRYEVDLRDCTIEQASAWMIFLRQMIEEDQSWFPRLRFHTRGLRFFIYYSVLPTFSFRYGRWVTRKLEDLELHQVSPYGNLWRPFEGSFRDGRRSRRIAEELARQQREQRRERLVREHSW